MGGAVSQCMPSSREFNPMMKFQVQGFRAPGWVLPIVLLVGLALIPVALFIALAVLGLGLAAAIVRAVLPSATKPSSASQSVSARKASGSFSNQPVLDVEYEIKDEHEKAQRK
jgi:hypothetical protein